MIRFWIAEFFAQYVDRFHMPHPSDPSNPLRFRFALDGAHGEVMAHHLRIDQDNAVLSKKFRLYYKLRPFIPIILRQRLQRGRNHSIDVPDDWFLPQRFVHELRSVVEQGPHTPVIHPWPDGFQLATVLTHDVETKDGVALVDELARAEESLGFRSAWNFIPRKYDIDPGLLADLKNRGHEIGVHGYNHDGRLFESRQMFMRRTKPINDAVERFGSTGFRAPMVHRNLSWLQDLNVDYDASCFDVDPFQAMPGGVGSVWPFMAGKLVELPYTLPQDHTLLITLGETTPNIWIKKMEFLRRLSGMAMLITHPDYLDTPARLGVYRGFLEHVAQQSDSWNALPCEVSRWWRDRDESTIRGDNLISGPAATRGRVIRSNALLAP
ncbi:MAG: hypothetical protein AAF989_00270 [Planctomycetota bacterium]